MLKNTMRWAVIGLAGLTAMGHAWGQTAQCREGDFKLFQRKKENNG